MTRPRFGVFILVAIISVLALAACAEAQQPTATSVSFNPTPAGGDPTPVPPTPTPGAGPTATAAPAGGDPANGEALFAANGCAGCHSIDDSRVVGPGLKGIYPRAGTMTSLSADDYIRESIRQPGAFVVEGYIDLMPALPLSDAAIEDLLAYLKTLE